MLVVTRRAGQQIKVGDDVLVTIVRVDADGSVRVGIDAPTHIRVERVRREAAA